MDGHRPPLRHNASENLASLESALVAEEGFYFAQYEGGIRWHTLVRYTESAANKQFTFCPRKTPASVTI
jgi:hypothetical protein